MRVVHNAILIALAAAAICSARPQQKVSATASRSAFCLTNKLIFD
jgi:hypothetical protein